MQVCYINWSLIDHMCGTLIEFRSLLLYYMEWLRVKWDLSWKEKDVSPIALWMEYGLAVNELHANCLNSYQICKWTLEIEKEWLEFFMIPQNVKEQMRLRGQSRGYQSPCYLRMVQQFNVTWRRWIHINYISIRSLNNPHIKG